jgi:phage baseplate assembly protein W
MAAKKYLGIRFQFTAKDPEGFFVDLDSDPYKEIKSDLTHLLFTPIGQRIRKPNFGSKLIQNIFQQNDDITYTDIKLELESLIKKYFPGVTITEMEIKKTDDDIHGANVSIKYQIDEGDYRTFDSIDITL